MSRGSNRSKPALTAVCVVNTFPARVIFMARSKGFLVIFHIGPSAFKHRECCVPFVQVTDLRREAQSSQ